MPGGVTLSYGPRELQRPEDEHREATRNVRKQQPPLRVEQIVHRVSGLENGKGREEEDGKGEEPESAERYRNTVVIGHDGGYTPATRRDLLR